MDVQIMYFGMLSEITGQSNESSVLAEGITVGDFKHQIEDKYPLLKGKKFKVAVNKQISDDSTLIRPNSELALLPPFAGG
jgi:molybdopterin synthase sulfur carrier subunit